MLRASFHAIRQPATWLLTWFQATPQPSGDLLCFQIPVDYPTRFTHTCLPASFFCDLAAPPPAPLPSLPPPPSLPPHQTCAAHQQSLCWSVKQTLIHFLVSAQPCCHVRRSFPISQPPRHTIQNPVIKLQSLSPPDPLLHTSAPPLTHQACSRACARSAMSRRRWRPPSSSRRQPAPARPAPHACRQSPRWAAYALWWRSASCRRSRG